MNDGHQTELVIIGGSAGSLPVVMQIIQSLPAAFVTPVVFIIHRQRNVVSEFTDILLRANQQKNITEPDDKEPIRNSCIYIAPQNYHLLIESDRTFSLDYSEAVRFSRPSIDVSFESAARVYKSKLAAIILSGANNDGAAGMMSVAENGGIAVAQHPLSAAYPAMPNAAIAAVAGSKVLTPGNICAFIESITCK